MRQQYVMGNWKMNGNRQQIRDLLAAMVENYVASTAKCVVFPPSIYLPLINEFLEHSPIQWGAQNVYPQNTGAYTGELSSPMLKDFKCSYVLVGHSERRSLFHEDEKFVAEKFHQIKLHDMIPVLCVGETLEQREQGLTEEVISKQLLAIKDREENFKDCIVAYEPVWAIGTGRTASPEQVQEVHVFIRTLIGEFNKTEATALPIVYGGSVNEKNALSLFSMPDVDGGLVGGASLNAQQFLEILKCIN